MTFFYDKPLQINTGINLPNITTPAVKVDSQRYGFFNSGLRAEDSFGKKAMPFEVTENKIQELAMNNPRIMQIINENKLWEY